MVQMSEQSVRDESSKSKGLSRMDVALIDNAKKSSPRSVLLTELRRKFYIFTDRDFFGSAF
jgi:hypothetical protein